MFPMTFWFLIEHTCFPKRDSKMKKHNMILFFFYPPTSLPFFSPLPTWGDDPIFDFRIFVKWVAKKSPIRNRWKSKSLSLGKNLVILNLQSLGSMALFLGDLGMGSHCWCGFVFVCGGVAGVVERCLWKSFMKVRRGWSEKNIKMNKDGFAKTTNDGKIDQYLSQALSMMF